MISVADRQNVTAETERPEPGEVLNIDELGVETLAERVLYRLQKLSQDPLVETHLQARLFAAHEGLQKHIESLNPKSDTNQARAQDIATWLQLGKVNPEGREGINREYRAGHVQLLSLIDHCLTQEHPDVRNSQHKLLACKIIQAVAESAKKLSESDERGLVAELGNTETTEHVISAINVVAANSPVPFHQFVELLAESKRPPATQIAYKQAIAAFDTLLPLPVDQPRHSHREIFQTTLGLTTRQKLPKTLTWDLSKDLSTFAWQKPLRAAAFWALNTAETLNRLLNKELLTYALTMKQPAAAKTQRLKLPT